MRTAPAPAPTPPRAAIWLGVTRPRTLAAGAVPVLVGTALAISAGTVRPARALAALAGALLLQVGCNLTNDLFDHLHGADGDDRLGPARAAASGWLSTAELAWASAAVFGAAVAIGAWLAAVAGWPVIAIGLAGVVAAVGYTAGPRPLGYLGLGDVLVFVFFGPVAVAGTWYVQAGTVTAAALAASVPIGLLTTAILVVNNLRDRHSDARAGKLTLAVRLGERGARLQYQALLLAAYAVPLAAVALGGGLGWLLPLASAPLALRRLAAVRTLDGAALNPELGATAKLLAVYGLLLALGLAVAP